MNSKPKTVLIWGTAISLVATVIRLNARAIAWPRNPAWQAIVGDGPIEGTRYYALELAIADVSNLFLAFGLVLVAAAVVRHLFSE